MDSHGLSQNPVAGFEVSGKRLALVGGTERLPMTNLDDTTARRVDATLDLAREQIEMLRQEHIL